MVFSKHNFNICDHAFKTQFHLKGGFGSAFAASTFAATHILAFFFFQPQRFTFNREQCTDALFMDSQISLFNHFFIKNESHDSIHTFKNDFVTVFSVFSFNKISSI